MQLVEVRTPLDLCQSFLLGLSWDGSTSRTKQLGHQILLKSFVCRCSEEARSSLDLEPMSVCFLELQPLGMSWPQDWVLIETSPQDCTVPDLHNVNSVDQYNTHVIIIDICCIADRTIAASYCKYFYIIQRMALKSLFLSLLFVFVKLVMFIISLCDAMMLLRCPQVAVFGASKSSQIQCTKYPLRNISSAHIPSYHNVYKVV